MNVHVLLLVLAVSAPKPMRYRHLETTGLTDELQLADGARQAIQFARESDATSLRRLRALLDCGIFGSNERIVLTGELKEKVLHTPSAPNRAASEPYREFVLRAWTVEGAKTLQKSCPAAFKPQAPAGACRNNNFLANFFSSLATLSVDVRQTLHLPATLRERWRTHRDDPRN